MNKRARRLSNPGRLMCLASFLTLVLIASFGPTINSSVPDRQGVKTLVPRGNPMDMAVNGEYVAVVYYELLQEYPQYKFKIWFLDSFDNGDNWNEPVLLSDWANLTGSVSVATNGKVVHVLFSVRERRSNNGSIMYMKKNLSNTSWTEPFRITPLNDSIRYAGFSIAVEGENLYVVSYQSYRGPEDIVLFRSVDSGDSWLPITHVVRNLVIVDAPTLSFSVHDGQIFLPYYDSDDESNGLWFIRSTDGGASWSKPVLVDFWGSAPKIRYDKGVLYLIYYNWYDGNLYYITKSNNSGIDWSPRKRLGDHQPHEGGLDFDIAVHSSDIFFVYGYYLGNHTFDIYLNYSNNGGNSWRGKIELLSNEKDLGNCFLGLSKANFTIHLIWGAENENGSSRSIYYTTLNLTSGTEQDPIEDGDNKDSDNDGYNNTIDPFPHDQAEWNDTDGDGIGDNSDQDIDNDSFNNTIEKMAGTDPFNSSSFPTDTDVDTIIDRLDMDIDGDGWNNTIEEDVSTDIYDNLSFPNDLDEDAVPDQLDQDIDGDGFQNNLDIFPNHSGEWNDMDGDGTGDNSDQDPDADGWNNTVELQLQTDPYDNSSHPSDLDSDGIPDALDPDRDGDDVPNEEDAFPDDPGRWEVEGSGEGKEVWRWVAWGGVSLMIMAAAVVVLWVYGKRGEDEVTEKADEMDRVAVREEDEDEGMFL